eukprot:753374-Hanusia_phi.AAC.16
MCWTKGTVGGWDTRISRVRATVTGQVGQGGGRGRDRTGSLDDPLSDPQRPRTLPGPHRYWGAPRTPSLTRQAPMTPLFTFAMNIEYYRSHSM